MTTFRKHLPLIIFIAMIVLLIGLFLWYVLTPEYYSFYSSREDIISVEIFKYDKDNNETILANVSNYEDLMNEIESMPVDDVMPPPSGMRDIGIKITYRDQTAEYITDFGCQIFDSHGRNISSPNATFDSDDFNDLINKYLPKGEDE